jgi:hypothetical protein
MKTFPLWLGASVALFAASCGRTGTICETATDCPRGQACTVNGCVPVPSGGAGGGLGGGLGGGTGGGGVVGGGPGGGIGGGIGGGLGGGLGGGIGGGGGSNCQPGETQCGNGCVNLGSDVDHCGACNQPCFDGPNSTATCSSGSCSVRCARGFADCDFNPRNGCEADLSNSATCGACRNACPSGPNAGATCTMGVCGLTCSPGFGDCDGLTTNGCETDLNSSATCGSCSNVCPAGQMCTNGSCGGACPATAVGVLNVNATVMGTLISGVGRFPVPTCSPQSNRFEEYWTLVITAPSLVTLETGGSLDTVLMLRSSCASTSDLACNDDTPGLGQRSRIITMLQPGSYAVFVKQWGTSGMGGAYSLSASVNTMGNAACAGATPLAIGGMPVTAEVIDTGGPGLTNCLPGQAGRVRYYSVVVPARGAVNVSGTPDVFDLGLRVFSSCAAMNTCAAFSDGIAAPAPESLRITNASSTPQTFIVVASSSFAGGGGTFSMAANAANPPAAPNAFCNTATALAPNTSISNELVLTGGMPLMNVCLPQQSGYARYYTVPVPPGNTLQAVVQPNIATGLDVGVRVLSSCAASSCLTSSDTSSNPFTSEGVVVSNSAAFTQNVLLAVTASNTSPPPGNTFGVQTSVTMTASNATCAGASPLLVGQTLMGETLSGGGPPTSACLPSANGLTKYYRVTLASSEQVAITALPSDFDVNVRVFDACGTTSCVAAADVALGIGPERVTVQNQTAAPKTYVIAVSAPLATTAGTFSLSVQRTAYTSSRITASCSDLSMAPDLLGPMTTPPLDDDLGTGALALPAGFTFPFFSTPVTHFSACMNGFVQLLPSVGVATDCSFNNQAMPNTASPNGFVAPLWDDLIPNPTTRIRTLTSGASPTRVFAIEWFDTAFINGSSERMTFQAKLFEGSGAIEFHYCSLQANGGSNDLLTGSTSTIGLESLAGTEALQHSSDTANSITNGSGLRFVPQ